MVNTIEKTLQKTFNPIEELAQKLETDTHLANLLQESLEKAKAIALAYL